jgi:hypothetical protein
MERRKLLQALTALPAMAIAGKSRSDAVAYEIAPNKKYIVFINPLTIDVETFCNDRALGEILGPAPVYCVLDGDMENAIRIYEVEKS